MNTFARPLISAAAIIAGLASQAHADTLTGRFSYSHLSSINITSPTLSGNVNTVKFNWTRQDLPGDGVEPLLPTLFNSACIEPAQTISSGTNHVFNVLTPAEFGYSPMQVTMLQRLWADFYPQVDTADESAAFQMSVWEIVHDENVDLSAGLFRVNSAIAATTLATGWLGNVSAESYVTSAPLPDLVVLESSTVQNQIAAIPAPATGALAVLAAAGILARRRRD